MLLKAKKIKFILLINLLFLSCNTINYKLVEKLDDKNSTDFYENIKMNSPFIGRGTVKGIYTERNNSYRYEVFYDLTADFIRVKFNSLLKNEPVFEARYEDNENHYDFFVQSFFSVKIGIILDKLRYFLNVAPKEYTAYRTNDDFLVIIDENKNYHKFEKNLIIKKENTSQLVRYNYENDKLKIVEFRKSGNSVVFLIEEIIPEWVF